MSRKAFLRQESLIDYIKEAKESSVLELCNHFKVSEATIRRDLNELEDLGKIERVLGGARSLANLVIEPPILTRMVASTPEKSKIGKAAADLISEGDTIFISSGTTSYQAALHLMDRKNITVISNSLPVINLLSRNPEINIIVLGGVLRHSEQSFVGSATEEMIKNFRADKVIMGVRAIHSEHGLTNYALQETQIDRQIIKITQNIIIVADHRKFGNIAPHFLASLSSVTHLITDKISQEDKTIFKEKGIDLIIA